MEVREKLEQAAEQLHLPPWPAAAAQAHPPACAILARRFGKGLRILAAVAAFEGVLAREHLITIALDKLTNRQVSFHPQRLAILAVHTNPCTHTSQGLTCLPTAAVSQLKARHFHVPAESVLGELTSCFVCSCSHT